MQKIHSSSKNIRYEEALDQKMTFPPYPTLSNFQKSTIFGILTYHQGCMIVSNFLFSLKNNENSMEWLLFESRLMRSQGFLIKELWNQNLELFNF